MTVHQPPSRVVRFESDDCESLRWNRHRVFQWIEISCTRHWQFSSVQHQSGQGHRHWNFVGMQTQRLNEEQVTVQVEGMADLVEFWGLINHDKLNNRVQLHLQPMNALADPCRVARCRDVIDVTKLAFIDHLRLGQRRVRCERVRKIVDG